MLSLLVLRAAWCLRSSSVLRVLTPLTFRTSVRGQPEAGLTTTTTTTSGGMDLRGVVAALERFAPLHLAESWDNVGLLLAPSSPSGQRSEVEGGEEVKVRSVLLTNDLTEAVMDEAERSDVQLLVSYHPPVFSAIKRLAGETWKTRIVARCMERRLAVYSPHTCWDAVRGGVNDWLAGAFETTSVRPIRPSPGSYPAGCTHWVLLDAPSDVIREGTNESGALNRVKEMASSGNPAVTKYRCSEDEDGTRVEFWCKESVVVSLAEILTATALAAHTRITKLEKLGPLSDTGMGRLCILAQPLTLSRVVSIIKGHLKLTHVRVALGRGRSMEDESVRSVAVCAGSGASVLLGGGHAPLADVLWTGEMSHHEALEATHGGATVVLCEHSNTERGFLAHFAPQMERMTEGKVKVKLARTDVDPLVVM